MIHLSKTKVSYGFRISPSPIIRLPLRSEDESRTSLPLKFCRNIYRLPFPIRSEANTPLGSAFAIGSIPFFYYR